MTAFDDAGQLPESVPATAQAAGQQGDYVGQSIAALYTHQPVAPYRYHTLGHLALLGRYTGVAKIGAFSFDGIAAWLFWHIAYLARNPSWSKRIRLVVDWLLAGLLGRETGELRLGTVQPRSTTVAEVSRHGT